MYCVECGVKVPVEDSRHTKTGIVIRYHICPDCGCKFWTKEEYVDYEDIKEEHKEIKREDRKRRAEKLKKLKEINNGKDTTSSKI